MVENIWREVQEIAEKRVTVIMAGLLEKNPSADKETDAMAWVGHMNMLKAMAEEIMDCSWNSRDLEI